MSYHGNITFVVENEYVCLENDEGLKAESSRKYLIILTNILEIVLANVYKNCLEDCKNRQKLTF